MMSPNAEDARPIRPPQGSSGMRREYHPAGHSGVQAPAPSFTGPLTHNVGGGGNTFQNARGTGIPFDEKGNRTDGWTGYGGGQGGGNTFQDARGVAGMGGGNGYGYGGNFGGFGGGQPGGNTASYGPTRNPFQGGGSPWGGGSPFQGGGGMMGGKGNSGMGGQPQLNSFMGSGYTPYNPGGYRNWMQGQSGP